MRTATGLVNQYIEIYSDQDYDNNSGGVIPNSVSYWSTIAEVKTISARRDLSQAQEQFKPAFTFLINDRNDKNVKANMLLKWRGSWFTIQSSEPDYVYQQMLKITAITSDPPARSENYTGLVEYGFTTINPFGIEETIDLQFSVDAPDKSNFTLDFTDSGNLKYLLVSTPDSFPIPNFYLNVEGVTEGPIQDSRMRLPVVKNGRRYIITRVPFAFDSETTEITFKVI